MMKRLAFFALLTALTPNAHALIGDGVTDETTELQQILNNARDGDSVTIPPGTYLISSVGIIRNNLLVNGTGVTLKRIPNVPLDKARMIRINGSGVTFKGFTLDGNSENNMHLGFYATVTGQPTASRFQATSPFLSNQNNAYVGLMCRIIYGNLRPLDYLGEDGEVSKITAYNGATKEFTVSPPFSAAPAVYSNFEVVDESDYTSAYGGHIVVLMQGSNVTAEDIHIVNFRTGTLQRKAPVLGSNASVAFYVRGDNALLRHCTVNGLQGTGIRLSGAGPRKELFRVEGFSIEDYGYKGFSYDGDNGIKEIQITDFSSKTNSPHNSQEGILMTNLLADQDFTTIQIDTVRLKNIHIEGGHGQGMKLIGINKAYLENIDLHVDQDPSDPYFRVGQALRLFARHAIITNIFTDRPIQTYGHLTVKNMTAANQFEQLYLFAIDSPGMLGRERMDVSIDGLKACNFKIKAGNPYFYMGTGHEFGPHPTQLFLNNSETCGNGPLFCTYHDAPPNPRYIALGPNITHPGPLHCGTNVPLTEIIQNVSNPVAPTIGSHPVDVTIPEGLNGQFSVGVSNPLPTYYQWQKNGVDIIGADGPVLSIAGASSADQGARFRCRVENIMGLATSNEATLTVSAAASPDAIVGPFVNSFQPLQGEVISMPVTMNRPGSIKADVQTRQGVLVRHLINQEAQAGVVTVTWDGRNENNSVVAAGVYSIALQAAGKKSFHKVILLK
jgi:hypothetical protein